MASPLACKKCNVVTGQICVRIGLTNRPFLCVKTGLTKWPFSFHNLGSLFIFRSKQMHSVTNFFILNLAISDVVMCLFAVPFTPLQSFTGKWMFGKALCILFPFSQGVSVYISTLTLTIIALDRYLKIKLLKRFRDMGIVSCAWASNPQPTSKPLQQRLCS